MMLSSYVWNFEYNKELQKRTKEKYPNCLTITGENFMLIKEIKNFLKNILCLIL